MALPQDLRLIIKSIRNETCVVYSIFNTINGKIYVGKTKSSIITRFRTHKFTAKTSNLPLYTAVRKYGWSNFTIDILTRCNSLSELDEAEIYWIKFYNSRDRNIGYNIAEGGNKGNPFTPKVIKSLASSRKGKPLSTEHRKNISEGSKGAQLGKIVSKETKIKMSLIRTGVPLWNDEQKKQMSLNMTGSSNYRYVHITADQILNCFNKSISLKEMENILGVSGTTITRKIKELFNCSPKELREKLGVKIMTTKLSDQDVLNIRERKKSGIKNTLLAKEYNVTPSLIGLIVNNKTRIKND